MKDSPLINAIVIGYHSILVRKKKKEKEFHFTENDVKYCAIWARLKEFFSDPANKQRQLAVKLRNLIQMYGLEHCLPVLFDVFSD